MIAINGERSVLVRIFSGRISPVKDGRKIGDLSQLPPAEVSAVYLQENAEQVVPDLLVLDTPNLQEFFAWSSTYLPHWSPLSAGMRIVERRSLSDRSTPVSAKLPRQVLRGLLCVALGELLFEWQQTSGQATPNVVSFMSTFGYVATCAVIADRKCLNDLLSKWTRAQHLLQLPPRRLNSRTLKDVWEPLFEFFEKPLKADQWHTVKSELAQVIGKALPRPLLYNRSPRSEQPQRREHVVVELENFIRDTQLVDSSECFEAAAIASRMSSSPMSHFDVLSGMTKAEPRTLLWYSFLSGMFASEPAHATLENILYRVESDLRSQQHPNPDIILEELEALIGPHGRIPDGVGTGGGFISVEIESRICASFRLRREASPTRPQPTRLDDQRHFDELIDQLRRIFERQARFNTDHIPQPDHKKTHRRRGP